MELNFSFIIPVYNRPDEVRELLDSIRGLSGSAPFEAVVVEDGSEDDSEKVVAGFSGYFPLQYHKKENTGPGDSRNYGMRRATGNYFIILDSDCLLPPEYLRVVATELGRDFADCYGGPDMAHPNFSPLQKAVDYAMTAFLSTGGIRGGRHHSKGFEPRSFNMGLSKVAFQDSGGFGNIHPGEDPDLSIRLKAKGFKIRLIPSARVYHKRRVTFKAYFRQVRKFGKVRPILNLWHPQSRKLSYWLPSLFLIGLVFALVFLVSGPNPLRFVPLILLLAYLAIVLVDAWIRSSSPKVAIMAVCAVVLQFIAYGSGFLESTILVTFSGKKPNEVFPELFYQTLEK